MDCRECKWFQEDYGYRYCTHPDRDEEEDLPDEYTRCEFFYSTFDARADARRKEDGCN